MAMQSAPVALTHVWPAFVAVSSPSAAERVFRLALKYATGAKAGHLTEGDVLRAISKAGSDSNKQAIDHLTRATLGSITAYVQRLAADAVALQLDRDSFAKKMCKLLASCAPPLMDEARDIVHALADAVADVGGEGGLAAVGEQPYAANVGARFVFIGGPPKWSQRTTAGGGTCYEATGVGVALNRGTCGDPRIYSFVEASEKELPS